MRIRNFTSFDKEATKNWNLLRDQNINSNYYVSDNKQGYLDQIKKFKIDKTLSVDFENIFSKSKINRLISFCSGSCMLEYYLKNKYKLYVEVSDYTDSILRIKNYKLFDRVSKIDFTNKIEGNFEETDIILLSRIDTEFEDEELISVFKSFKIRELRKLFFCLLRF